MGLSYSTLSEDILDYYFKSFITAKKILQFTLSNNLWNKVHIPQNIHAEL